MWFAAVAHGAQFLAMIAISSTAALFEPVVPTVRPIIENGQFTGVEPSNGTRLAGSSRLSRPCNVASGAVVPG